MNKAMGWFDHMLSRYVWFKVIFILSIPAIILLAFYVSSLNFTEPTELGIARNIISGEMWPQDGGWHRTAPWVLVSVVDLRPMKMAVSTAGQGYGAKLVQFDPAQWEEFVKTEGFRYWWWANRISFNMGYDETYRGIRDILRGYAYGVKRYSFITVSEVETK